MSTSLTITTKQARSQKTLERILDATEKLLIETDYSELSLKQIARAAGVTTGAIYARVENKAALLDVLFSRYNEKGRAALEAFLAEAEQANAKDVVSLMIRALTELFVANRGIVRTALTTEQWNTNGQIREDAAAFFERARQRLEQCATDLGNPAPKVASTFALTLVISACRETIVLNEHVRYFDIDLDVFQRELTHAIHCYLKG